MPSSSAAPSAPSSRVGFIGLGNQGMPIAAHLAPAGLETTVYDLVDASVQELVSSGAKAAASPREVGASADVIGICVPEDHHVRAVMLGEDGLLAGAASGALVMIHSTVQPETVAELARVAAEQGVDVVDACVSGGEAGARSKQLTYMVGAEAAAMERARSFFEATTEKDVIFAGALGNGCKLKLALNVITYIQWAAASESFQLARAAGLPTELLEEAGRSNGQLTPMMQQYLVMQKPPREQVAAEDTQAYLRRTMLIAEKDLAWALQLARKSEISMPVTGLVSQHMARLYRVEDEKRR